MAMLNNQMVYIYVNRMIPVPDVTNSIPEHLAFVSSSVSMAATEERLIFLEMGTWANSALANGPLKYCGVYVRCIPV